MSTGDQYAGAEKKNKRRSFSRSRGSVDCTNFGLSGNTARRMEGEKKNSDIACGSIPEM
jgi:hypothetical protein